MSVSPLFPKNRAKIIATLGPASATDDILTALIRGGASVIRLNMSHGTHETHGDNIQRIRRVAKTLNQNIGILVDLQGPKLRTGLLVEGKSISLVRGHQVMLKASLDPGTDGVITTPSFELVESLALETLLLLDDGRLRLQVVEQVNSTEVLCEIIQGGRLSERKGINVPNTSLSFQALTEKDKEDTLFAIQNDVDYLALSFVRNAEDIKFLQRFILESRVLKADQTLPPIISKIEKPEALDDIDEILDVSFGLMVARGDLGVELPPQEVPIVQKQLIRKCREREKPVIVATQMLESMMTSVHPSRAEVSDIANAVFDGTDALMLSGESAAGENPIASVQMMSQIISEAEAHYTTLQNRPHEKSTVQSPHFHHTIAHAASYAAIKANVKALVVLSSSGQMAQRISKLKPHRRIIALTEDEATCRRMTLLWGVTPLKIKYGETTEEIINHGEEAILKRKLLTTGDSILFCAGNTPIIGATNMLKLFHIGEAVRSAIGIL